MSVIFATTGLVSMAVVWTTMEVSSRSTTYDMKTSTTSLPTTSKITTSSTTTTKITTTTTTATTTTATTTITTTTTTATDPFELKGINKTCIQNEFSVLDDYSLQLLIIAD